MLASMGSRRSRGGLGPSAGRRRRLQDQRHEQTIEEAGDRAKNGFAGNFDEVLRVNDTRGPVVDSNDHPSRSKPDQD